MLKVFSKNILSTRIHFLIYKIFLSIFLFILNFFIIFCFYFLFSWKLNVFYKGIILLFFVNILVVIYIYIMYYKTSIVDLITKKYKYIYNKNVYIFINFYLLIFFFFNFYLLYEFYTFLLKISIINPYIKLNYFDNYFVLNNYWIKFWNEKLFNNVFLDYIELFLEKKNFTNIYIEWYQKNYLWSEYDILYYTVLIHVYFNVFKSQIVFFDYFLIFNIIPEIFYDQLFFKSCLSQKFFNIFEDLYIKNNFIEVNRQILNNFFKHENYFSWTLNTSYLKFNCFNIIIFYDFIFNNKLYIETLNYDFFLQIGYLLFFFYNFFILIFNFKIIFFSKYKYIWLYFYCFCFIIFLNFFIINIFISFKFVMLFLFYFFITVGVLSLNFLILLYSFLLGLIIKQKFFCINGEVT